MTQFRLQLNQAFKEFIDSEFSESFLDDLTEKCIDIARKRVPIDTHALQEDGIKGVHYKENETTYVVDIFVNDLPHPSTRNLSMGTLGLILNMKDMRRSQSQPKNPEGSTTAGWWDQAWDDIEKLVDEMT